MDDYDSEFRYVGRPLAALQGIDRANRVLYLGTVSKVLFPAVRLGYLVVPPDLVKAFIAARLFTNIHPPLLEQVSSFSARGIFCAPALSGAATDTGGTCPRDVGRRTGPATC